MISRAAIVNTESQFLVIIIPIFTKETEIGNLQRSKIINFDTETLYLYVGEVKD
jgi:riboflavin synthase alpha subunit